MNEDPHLKALLLRDKEFLRSLYASESGTHSKTILNFATDAKLNTLIKFLFAVSNGQIKVKKEHFDSLTHGHLKIIKKHLESKVALRKLLNEDRRVKLQILSKLKDVFPQLLFTLFNQILIKK